MTYLTSVLDLPAAELHTMRLDGELSAQFTFLDEPDTEETRARRILSDMKEVLVLSSWSAAWAWDCASEPSRHVVAFREHRTHVPDRYNFIVEQRSFHNGDILGFNTSPLRTTIDLLKTRTLTQAHAETARTLMSRFNLSPDQLIRHGRERVTAPHQHLLARNIAQLEMA